MCHFCCCCFNILHNQQVLTAQVSDTGRYVCVADNVAGSAEKPFNLNVHGAFQLFFCLANNLTPSH